MSTNGINIAEIKHKKGVAHAIKENLIGLTISVKRTPQVRVLGVMPLLMAKRLRLRASFFKTAPFLSFGITPTTVTAKIIRAMVKVSFW
jgi:hypothetical protein